MPDGFFDTGRTLSEVAAAIAQTYPPDEFRFVFPQGDFVSYAMSGTCLCFWRRSGSDPATGTTWADACVVINTSSEEPSTISLPMPAQSVSRVDTTAPGTDPLIRTAPPAKHDPDQDPGGLPWLLDHVPMAACIAEVEIAPMGCAALLFHDDLQLQKPMSPGLGVLAHVTSLPNRHSDGALPGTVSDAFGFVDWLADAGAAYWQVLPLNPPDSHMCPYAGKSAFAGSPLLLGGDVARRAAELAAAVPVAYAAFCDRERGWLDDYAAFDVLSRLHDGAPWWEWPGHHRDHGRLDLSDVPMEDVEGVRKVQFLFDVEWRRLRERARSRGVSIIGDMAIYVSHDSADVWANRELFQLDDNGMCSQVSGCPPNGSHEHGQVWGHPLYNWDRMRGDGFSWWLSRMRRAFGMYDFVRLDHFLGFARYWSIPAGKTGLDGEYLPGPGIGLFDAAYREFGPLPLLAEDIGIIVPGVSALLAECGFPGMEVLQYAWGGDPLSTCRSGYDPRPGKIVYSGTHDTDTLIGYAYGRYPGCDTGAVADEMIDALASCGADVVILPLQDVMGLDGYSRMNTPGTVAPYNWAWRAAPGTLGDEGLKHRLSGLVERHRQAS